jgi:ribonucleotide reductase alpha subunit
MLQTGEPGFSVDVGPHSGENLRNACLAGDTLVAVADGRGVVAIKDLVGQSTPVYSSDGTGNIKVGTLRNVRVTRRGAKLVRVTFDDGTHLRVTPDHLIMLANGSFVEAGKLKPGMSVMPFASKVYQKYRRVRCRRRWDKQCNVVLGRPACTRDGRDVHHINDDCLDDRLSNLALLSHEQHASLKMRGNKNPTRRLEHDLAWRVRHSKASAGTGNGRYTDGTRTRQRALAQYHDLELKPRGVSGVCEVCQRDFTGRPGARTCGKSCGATLGLRERRQYEQRVVAAVVPDGIEDVYDGTVDGLHCFAVVTTTNPDLKVGEFGGVIVHNCTEVTSSDDNDMCNLSAVNMARIETKEEFHEVLGLVVPFLLCGSLYSKLPVPDMYRVREKNRRIGVGLMGVHEWLLKRGHRYGRCDELAEWMQVYSTTGIIANYWADRLNISRPVATRSIAPTGTISIVAETTSGIEPIMAVAYKRRYLDGSEWKAQCVVDPTAKRLIDQGVDPELIEDSLTLAEDVERRMSFQSWLQAHVDHGISSTINLPPWGSSLNNEGTVTSFGNTLLKYLPTLRGITAYPDGARMGQPITRMPYHEAISRAGVVFLDGSDEQCPTGVCGI